MIVGKLIGNSVGVDIIKLETGHIVYRKKDGSIYNKNPLLEDGIELDMKVTIEEEENVKKKPKSRTRLRKRSKKSI